MDETVQRAIREAARAGAFLVPAPPEDSLELIQAILTAITVEIPNEREQRASNARMFASMSPGIVGDFDATLERQNRHNFHVWTSATNEIRARFGAWLQQAAEVGIKGYRGQGGRERPCENESCKKPLPTAWPAVYCSTRCALDDA